MKAKRPRKQSSSAFTLVELLVVIAIIGVLVALLLPAIQAAREAARRSQCLNNIRQVSIAMLNYESAKKGLPPIAKYWCNAATPKCTEGYPTGRPGGWYDDHGWYIPVMPYMEGQAVVSSVNPNLSFSDPANLQARQAMIPSYACPSDIGLQRNEWSRPNWARVRTSYVVNGGNTVYGQHNVGNCPGGVFPDCVRSGGAPFIPKKNNRLATVSDGTANTLMMSEVWILPETENWGGPYSDAQTALGGQMFTGYFQPNYTQPDGLARRAEWWSPNADVQAAWLQAGLPGGAPGSPLSLPARDSSITQDEKDAATMDNGSDGVKQQFITARSRHPGGVNASRCDASTGFYSDSIDRYVWNSLTSAAGGEVFEAPN